MKFVHLHVDHLITRIGFIVDNSHNKSFLNGLVSILQLGQESKEFEFYDDNNAMNGDNNDRDRVKGQSSIEMNGNMNTVKGQENGIV